MNNYEGREKPTKELRTLRYHVEIREELNFLYIEEHNVP